MSLTLVGLMGCQFQAVTQPTGTPTVKTKPSKTAKAKRVDAKKGRSQIKAGRAKVRLD